MGTSGFYCSDIVVVVVFLYCPDVQNINYAEDISVDTDESRHFSVINIDVETQ